MSTPSLLSARRALLAASALALTLTAAGCGGGGGPAPTSGSIKASGIFSSGGAATCTDSSTWVYTPVTLESTTDGSTSQAVHTHGGQTILAANGTCTSSDSGLSLRFGTWRVTWSGRPGVACNLNIRQQNWVTIEQNGNCKTTF